MNKPKVGNNEVRLTLTDEELWERIKRLEGGTVYTIQYRIPSKIAQVTDSHVKLLRETGEPKLVLFKKGIVSSYRYLVKHGQITHKDIHNIRHLVYGYQVVEAILRDAVPEQIEELYRGPGGACAGIRLKVLGGEGAPVHHYFESLKKRVSVRKQAKKDEPKKEIKPLYKVIPINLSADKWEELSQEATELGIEPTTLARIWILERLRK